MARSKAPRIGVALLAMAGTLAGCAVVHAIFGGEEPFVFPHRIHYEDEGLDCADCHRKIEEEDGPGMPTLRQCMLCHEEIDSEKPPDRQVSTFFSDNEWIPTGTALSSEVIFSHRQHAVSDYECSSCHIGIETNESTAELPPIRMDDCSKCHVDNQIAADCATCHRELREDVAPPTHQQNWKGLHGRVVRAHSELTANRCTMCHAESTCVTCHLDEQPESHNNYFRLRGHGIVASMDRRNCMACHRSDFCDRCHENAEPLSHQGSWGSPVNQHCNSCHFPLSSTRCYTCHKSTPSHGMAPPKPPNHTPGMNCRQCHGSSAPLLHVDNGSDCNICHQ